MHNAWFPSANALSPVQRRTLGAGYTWCERWTYVTIQPSGICNLGPNLLVGPDSIKSAIAFAFIKWKFNSSLKHSQGDGGSSVTTYSNHCFVPRTDKKLTRHCRQNENFSCTLLSDVQGTAGRHATCLMTEKLHWESQAEIIPISPSIRSFTRC